MYLFEGDIMNRKSIYSISVLLLLLMVSGCSSDSSSSKSGSGTEIEDDNTTGGGTDEEVATLGAPSNLVVASAARSHCMVLNWDDNSGKEKVFEIERVMASGWSKIREVGANVHEDIYDCDNITYLQNYCYRVRAVDDALMSDYTAETCAAHTFQGGSVSTPPMLPDNLAADVIQQAEGKIKVSWRDNASNEDYFKIFRSTTDDFSTAAVVGTVGADIEEFEDSGLDSCQLYYYWVGAYNSVGYTIDEQAYISVTTSPSAPQDFYAYKGPGVFSVQMQWTEESCATAYNVYVMDDYAVGYRLLTPGGIPDNNLTVINADEDIYYFLRVSAIDANSNEGALSCRVVSDRPQGGAASIDDECMAAVAWAADADVENLWGTQNNYSDKVMLGWSSVILNWDFEGNPQHYATDYRVEVSEDNSSWTSMGLQSHPDDASAMTVTFNAGADKLYYFKIYTRYMYDLDLDGTLDLVESDPPMTITARTAAGASTTTTTLPRPWVLTSHYYANRIMVGWGSISGATGYRVYRSTDRDSGYSHIGTYGSSVREIYDDKVVPYTDYWYKVRAYNGSGDGLLSNPEYGNATDLNWDY